MTLKAEIAKISALAMILALPLVLAGCGPKPAPVPTDNANAPIDQTTGQNGLAPAEPTNSSDTSQNLFDNAPQSDKEIKSDADIEDILNNIDKDSGKTIKEVDDSDLNNF